MPSPRPMVFAALFAVCLSSWTSPASGAALHRSGLTASGLEASGARRAAGAPEPPGFRQKGPKPCHPRRGCQEDPPPTVSITEPLSGAVVAGTVTIRGTASDTASLVEVQVDGQPFLPATGTTNWSYELDTTAYADGFRTITARATDAGGNISPSSDIVLQVANAVADPNVLALGDALVDRPTLHTLGVQLPIAGDANRNASVSVRYREQGGGTWTEGPPLLRVFPETIAVAVPQQFAGSVFDLAPGTTYEIELRAIDPDGPVNEVRQVTATTREVPRADPESSRLVPVASTSSLKTALSAAQPGDVIVLAGGTYAGPFVLGASGTANRPIVIRSAGVAVLDGGNCKNCNVLEVGGSFVHVERLTIANAFRALRFTGHSTTGNVARRLQILNVVHGIASNAGQSDFYVCDNVVDGRLHWPWVFGSRPSRHWDDRGIHVTGDGHVVCHNSIRGFGDPVANGKREARSWDVYGNDIADSWDGVELDEGQGNVRMFHNRFTNVMAPISIQPVFGGPAYAIRNVMFNVPDEPIKLKSLGGVEEPSGALVYHNTVVAPNRALNLLSGITQHNFAIENNLFVGPVVLADERAVDWRAGINQGVFDFNGYHPDGVFMFGTVGGVNRLYPSFADTQAGGQVETSGTLLVLPVFQGGFVGPADPRVRYNPAEFPLAAGSNAIDRGRRLPGINNGYTGEAPDLGALEAGCPVPAYGPRPEGLEGFTPAINCGGQ